mgnify:CR=1 FL=1
MTQVTRRELMPGVWLRAIHTDKFKSSYLGLTMLTPLERENPQILNASRKRRIAAGCGLQVVDVNRLLKSFEMLQQLTKSMSKGRFRGIPGMGGMPGMGGRGKMTGFGRKKRLK